jgi:hypothetical protein
MNHFSGDHIAQTDDDPIDRTQLRQDEVGKRQGRHDGNDPPPFLEETAFTNRRLQSFELL